MERHILYLLFVNMMLTLVIYNMFTFDGVGCLRVCVVSHISLSRELFTRMCLYVSTTRTEPIILYSLMFQEAATLGWVWGVDFPLTLRF